jgi:hypothetical protein
MSHGELWGPFYMLLFCIGVAAGLGTWVDKCDAEADAAAAKRSAYMDGKCANFCLPHDGMSHRGPTWWVVKSHDEWEEHRGHTCVCVNGVEVKI